MMKFLQRVFKRNKSLLLTNPMSEKGKLAKISDRMVNLAYQEIGVHEVNGSNCGVRVDQYKAAMRKQRNVSFPEDSPIIIPGGAMPPKGPVMGLNNRG